MSCAKQFSLSVAEPLPALDWNELVWDQAISHNGSSSVSAVGDAVTVDLAGIFPLDKFCQLHGSLTYTGPAIACVATLNLATTGFVGSLGEVGGRVYLRVIQDGVVRLGAGYPFPLAPTVLVQGVNTMPFLIVAGTSSLIEVQGFFTGGFLGNSGGQVYTQVTAWAFGGSASTVHYTLNLANA